MSISGMNNTHAFKTIIVYILCGIGCIFAEKVYGLFGHGVRSAAMTWMFLYPLLGGGLLFLLLRFARPRIQRYGLYRLGYNLYNAGIATLTTGSFLQGILEIAGTASPYVTGFAAAGGLLVTVGAAAAWVSTRSGRVYRGA